MDLTPSRLGLADQMRLAWLRSWRAALLLAIAVVLSVASFATTLQGFLTITSPLPDQQSWLSWVLAALVASGVQGLLLVCAWMIGDNITRNRSIFAEPSISKVVLHLAWVACLVTVFLVCLLVSVFFSYNTFYHAVTNIFGGSCQGANCTDAIGNRSPYINSLARVHVGKTTAQKLTDMRREAEEERQLTFDALTRPDAGTRARNFLRDNPSIAASAANWPGFVERMRDIIDLAKSSSPKIGPIVADLQAKALAESTAAARVLAEAKAAVDGAQSTAKAAAADVDRAAARTRDLEEKRDAAKAAIEQLQEKVREFGNRMECEDKGNQCLGPVPTKPGQGPKYTAAKAERDSAQQVLGQKIAERDAHIQQLADIKKVADEAVEKRDLAKKTEAQAQKTVDAPPIVRMAPLMPIADFDKLVSEMAEALTKLTEPAAFGLPPSTPSATTITATTVLSPAQPASPASAPKVAPLLALEALCGKIVDNLGQQVYEAGGIAETARKKRCARDGLAAAVERVQQLNAGLVAFDVGDDQGSCRVLGSIRDKDTNTIIKRGQNCLELVKLGGQPAENILDSFGKLEREHNKNVHPFVQSLNGLTAYGDDLAKLSLFIAAVVDLLVFFAGFFIASASLRKIDQIGSHRIGTDILDSIDDVVNERETDTRRIRQWRWMLRRVQPSPFQFEDGGAMYAGYIRDADLRYGLAQDDAVRQVLVQLVAARPHGVALARRWPDTTLGQAQDDGLTPASSTGQDDARFYILPEVLADFADEIRIWDQAFGATKSKKATRRPAQDQASARANTAVVTRTHRTITTTPGATAAAAVSKSGDPPTIKTEQGVRMFRTNQ